MPNANYPAETVATLTPGSVVTGQKKVAVTGTAVQLSAGALVNGVVIKALSTNAAAIVVGGLGVTNVTDGTGVGYVLLPGEAVSFAVSDVSVLYINGTAGDGVCAAGN